MSSLPSVVHSKKLTKEQSGEMLRFSRDSVQWEWMSMPARRLNPGETFEAATKGEEAAFVILGGRCTANWGKGPQAIGARKNVFDGLPYCLYLPTGHTVNFRADTACEIAECRVPSESEREPRLITPNDVVTSLRGGGNTSPQIVAIIRPSFPAATLLVIDM